MQFPIVREYRDDILNRNPENQIRGEPFKVLPGVWTRVIVPEHSPFFVSSLKLYFKNGEPMTEDHFEIYTIMPALTGLAAQDISCMIRLKDENITEGLLDYDVVGEFSLFDTSMMYLVMGAVADDRMIDWNNLKNKPVVFPPKLHTHSLLYDIVAFQDTINLLNHISEMMEDYGRPLVQVKIDHYFDLFNHYLNLYRSMLVKFLTRHAGAYNSHGLTAAQVVLENVDNFKTATTMAELMSGRNDLHLTVEGLRTIVEQTGYDTNEFLAKDTLPISQYGNTNFIPPSIDGSFEGLGGTSETAGICMESDGTVLFLSNRMDGRIRGLYFSTLSNPYSHAGKMTYTSYKYTHQRFEQDGTSVDRIAQGSGDEVILVGNNITGNYYLGLTYGTLDPTKTVYSRLNMDPILNIINPNDRANALAGLENLFGQVNVALMGDWIYVFFAHGYKTPGVPDDVGLNDCRYRTVFRVPTASVAAQLDVTLVQQNVTFTDLKGVRHTNEDRWRWANIVQFGSSPVKYNSYIFDFSSPPTQIVGCYRSQQTVVCAHRDKPGKFLLRFKSFYWSRYVSVSGTKGVEVSLEVLYEFDPTTNTFELIKSTPVPYIDWEGNVPAFSQELNGMSIINTQQGLAVLPDGGILASGGRYPAFPRLALAYRPATSKFDTMMLLWYDIPPSNWLWIGGYDEAVISPILSSIKPRSMLFAQTGNFYVAATNENVNLTGLFFRTVSGKLAARPDVTNLLINNVVSQPLTNTVKKVNAVPHIGGINVTVPSAQLDTYGMDVGDSAFAMSVQYEFLRHDSIGAYWPPMTNFGDVRMTSSHSIINESNGTLSILPTSDILYPAAIVEQLKAQVEFPALMAQSPSVPVTIADPNGRLSDKFGWMPTLVMVQYSAVGTVDFHGTLLSITPVYSTSGNTRTVTGFTVLDKIHVTSLGTVPAGWLPAIGGGDPNQGHGSMRMGVYVNGNELRIVFDSGVIFTGPGDGLRLNAHLRYPNKTTRRWSTAPLETYLNLHGNSGFTHWTVTPDNGPCAAYPYDVSTGGAATIYNGSVNKPLLGSVYPETGWVVFFQIDIRAVFNGKEYTLPMGSVDLRDFDTAPYNKTFYIYAKLDNGVPVYDVSQEKRLETPFQIWVAKVITNDRQIITIERYNVVTLNGNRISEIKRGNSIPGSSGVVNSEGQIPWLRADEMLP